MDEKLIRLNKSGWLMAAGFWLFGTEIFIRQLMDKSSNYRIFIRQLADKLTFNLSP